MSKQKREKNNDTVSDVKDSFPDEIHDDMPEHLVYRYLDEESFLNEYDDVIMHLGKLQEAVESCKRGLIVGLDDRHKEGSPAIDRTPSDYLPPKDGQLVQKLVQNQIDKLVQDWRKVEQAKKKLNRIEEEIYRFRNRVKPDTQEFK